jgi:UPF0755 protein
MSRRRGCRRLLLLGALAAAAAVAGTVAWIRAPFKGFSGASATIEFPIGTSTHQIFERLATSGVVRDASLAETYYRVFHRGRALRAGEYDFNGRESLDAVIGRIVRGEVVRHAVTIAEGLTKEEIFKIFLGQGIGTPQGFARASRETGLLSWVSPEYNDLEGFLFPDTYFVTRSTPTRQVLFEMIKNFERHFGPRLRQRMEDRGVTLLQTVTVAALVEKETAIASERPHVASVYWNRLRLGMRLQCDPTVIYALARDGKWNGRLRHSDLEYDSPYNTYRYAGLPPGPICNPGGASLSAAADPAATPDLYFVARGDGGHYFSTTYEEHLRSIEQSRRTEEAAAAAAGGSGAPPPPR